MPLSVKEGAMIGAGLTLVAGATIFYRRKQTLPFKIAYFLSWPTLGSAVILSMQPSNEKMTQVWRGSCRLRGQRGATPAWLE